MRTIIGSIVGALATGVLLIGYHSANRDVAGQAQVAPAAYAANARLVSDTTGMNGALANAATGPVLVKCEPNQQALIRETRALNGELLRQVECVGSAAASTPVYIDQYGRTVAMAEPRVIQSDLVTAPRAVRTVNYEPAPRRVVSTQSREVTRSSGRSWKKSALIIGGSAGTGAGVGAIAGGKKGAAIGAAVGGGVAALYEAIKR
jgi:hypothetical protein